MPLVQGHSPASVSANTRAERHAGRPEAQAVAIAERVADETRTHADAATPPTCNVLGWVVFWPGYWKNELYSVERCRRIPQNFRRLSNRVPRAKLGPGAGTPDAPAAKLGHDPEQLLTHELLADRLSGSLGFPSVGDVTRCDEVPGYPGYVEIDVRNVPTRLVGGEVAAGRYNGGSVELKPETRDPLDASRTIDGPILTGVAFLGEEPPALQDCHPDLQARTRPVATFDDGTPVPPNPGVPPEYPTAMSAVMRKRAAKFAAEFDAARNVLRLRDREFTAATVCFSDFQPEAAVMDPELEAKLKAAGLTPEQVAAVLPLLRQPPAPGAVPPPAPDADHDQMGEESAAPTEDMAAACRRYAEDPAATPEQKMMAAMFAEMGELKKRYSEVAAAQEETQKKDEAAKMAAFSDRVEQALKPVYRKVAPVVVEKVHKPTLMGVLTNKTFADEAERVRTFNDYVAALHALPDDPRLSQTAAGAETNARPGLTPLQRSMLESESARRYAPRVRDRLLGAAS